MTDPLRDRLAEALGPHYDIGAELGRGGMAVVFGATDLRLKRRVAVKLLPPELAFREDVRTRFLREAETAAQLSHPNIVPIFSVDERDGLVFFVMACVDGESLGARIARPPRLGIGEAQRVVGEVADALAYAHAHGVIHRDIKPDNILLDAETGRAMVTDFGIARAAEGDSRLTATGTAVGTPAYMSPEQAMGERTIDGRSDIYSLGVVAYQLLTGEPPFTASNTPAMLMKHLTEVPPPIRERRPDVPPAFAAAVERALAKRPEDRWPDAAAFREALTSSRPAPPPPRPAASPYGTMTGSAQRAASGGAPQRAAWEDDNAPRQWESGAPPESAYIPMTRREMRAEMRAVRRGALDPRRSAEARITSFRRNLAGQGVGIATLVTINLVTSPHAPWAIFPVAFMGLGIMRQFGSLWADGIGPRRIFGRSNAEAAALPAAEPPTSIIEREAAALVPADVLAGPHGAAVRRAVAERGAIRGVLDNLPAADRQLLPEITPTVEALVQRAASLAITLQHLEADVSSDTLGQLAARIAALQAEPEQSADRSRRLALLERQQGSLRELAERRTRLEGQLESAGLALENLKLDLIKLRSSGVQAAISGVNSATVEARALSREIGHVLEAADEVRNL